MFTRRDIKYFELAKNLASEAEHYKARIGAVIVRKNKILAKAKNAEKSHTQQMKYNRFRNIDNDGIGHNIHAELRAIIEAVNIHGDISGSKIYIWRHTNDKLCGMSRPCAACMAALVQRGVKDIYYTTENSMVYERMS